MKTMMRIFFAGAVLLASGCKTTEETKPVSWKEQSAYLAKVKDPRRFGYSIYQTPAGIDYRGGFRLHPNQIKQFSMESGEPLRPVGMLRGSLGLESPLLFDFTSSSSWLEFDLAQQLDAQPVSEGKAMLVKVPGEEIPGCLSVISTVRFGQVFMENPLVYVRMANGPLGSLARGIEKPAVKGVVGWDLLKKFEQVCLDYAEKKMVLSTAGVAYEPDPSLVVAKVPLVKHGGYCAMPGVVDGRAGPILFDPAGDFEIATDGAAPVSSVQLGTGLIFSAPAVTNSPGGTRIGARLLQNYRITVCPRTGVVYFEKPEMKK